MTCYFRHLKTVFEKAGITITIENKGTIDKAIHQIAGIKYKNCSATWKVVKKIIIEDEEDFVKTLKKSVKD